MLWLRLPQRVHTNVSRRHLTCCQAACTSTPTSTPAIWPGLSNYRTLPVDKGRLWGDQGPQEGGPSCIEWMGDGAATVQPATLAQWGARVLNTADPVAKAVLTHRAWTLWNEGGTMELGTSEAPARPARPATPPLVAPKLVPSQRDSGLCPAAYMYDDVLDGGVAHAACVRKSRRRTPISCSP